MEHPVQVVHERVELKVEEQDWSADDETTQRERLSKSCGDGAGARV